MLEDIVAPALDVLFVGYNPSVGSDLKGHHFAGPGNLFWALLKEADLTARRLTPEEDRELLYWGVGVTNLVERPTPGSGDLGLAERYQGAVALRQKIHRLKPKIAVFLGKDIFRAYREMKPSAAVSWGLQDARDRAVLEFVAPNPSRRSTVPYEFRVEQFRRIKNMVEWGTTPRHTT